MVLRDSWGREETGKGRKKHQIGAAGTSSLAFRAAASARKVSEACLKAAKVTVGFGRLSTAGRWPLCGKPLESVAK